MRLPSWVQTSPRGAPSLAEKQERNRALTQSVSAKRSGQCLFTTVPKRHIKNSPDGLSPQPLSRSERRITKAPGDRHHA